jgi:hypothetical protein
MSTQKKTRCITSRRPETVKGEAQKAVTVPLADKNQLSSDWTADISTWGHRQSPGFVRCYTFARQEMEN